MIVNLLAGGGRARRRWRQFTENGSDRDVDPEIHFTEYRGHAWQLARQAVANGHKRIVVFGGDGTLNEALNGVIEQDELIDPDIELVYLGAGSSCDVEKLFPGRLPLTGRVLSEKIYRSDVVKVRCCDPAGTPVTRYFLANSSLGVISESIVAFNRKSAFMAFLKRLNVDVAVLAAGFRTVLGFGNFSADITIDQTEHLAQAVKNVTVFKCAYFGGGMNYGVPSAFNDGRLHLAVIGGMGWLRTLSYIPSLYSGTVFKKGKAEYYQGQRVAIAGKDLKVAVEADGEIIGHPPCEYSILPQKVRLVL